MHVIEVLLFAIPALWVCYNLLFCMAATFSRKKKSDFAAPEKHLRFAILVPAYREDAIILSTVQHHEALRYPRGAYDIVIIADSLQPETLAALAATSAIVIPVSFEKSTKAKALNVAFASLQETYDGAIISDADNLLDPDFLLKMNRAFLDGHQVIQARRVAKNIDSPFAILDTANEIIANHIYRKGSNALGLSSSVIGSGMVFNYRLIKHIMAQIDATGEDKILQMMIAEKKVFRETGIPVQPILYMEHALVFDEKIDNPAAFAKQRKRWLAAQYSYLWQYRANGWDALRHGNFDYLNLFLCHNLMPPRMLLLAYLTIMPGLYLLLGSYLSLPISWWLILWALNACCLLLPIPRKFFARYFVQAILNLPRAIGIMLALLFRLKGAENTFIHTSHHKTVINNPLVDAEG
ncbi:glycosyltransferase family 2 protein [Chitinophaga sp. sic0106]|uniref:glycosyltransferase family 2 protein n=1 Tax=Chitinophaga sp. sic0106 TaxID=2854785 RepID=UPI001C464914|nr:glycosyltransferase family 2 protein [Chitinophaga sp. sic0106]MBV7531998.1 glycosyltransferase [Chitinophaga sp. sic0106]